MILGMKFGERLKFVRVAKCIFQKDVHTDLSIPQGSLSLIEKGKFIPRKEIIAKLADYLQINPYWLETGYSSPFESIKTIVELNKLKDRKSEKAAIELLNYEPTMTCLFHEKQNCLIYKDVRHKGACYIIFYLCEPFVLEDILRQIKGEVTYLGKVSNDAQLNDKASLRNLFSNVLKSKQYKSKEWILSIKVKVLSKTPITFEDAESEVLKMENLYTIANTGKRIHIKSVS